MSLLHVHERIWDPDAEPTFTSSLLGKDALRPLRHTPGYRRYVHALYLHDETPRLLVAHAGQAEETLSYGPVNRFVPYWMQQRPRTFSDCLYLIDTYRLSWRRDPDERPARFTSWPVIDAILQESRGLLLWHHQLEHLYRLAHPDYDDAIAFRHRLLEGHPSARRDAARLEIETGVTLLDVIDERMRYGITVAPNVRGARLLYHRCLTTVVN